MVIANESLTHQHKPKLAWLHILPLRRRKMAMVALGVAMRTNVDKRAHVIAKNGVVSI
jgi:hypothetical protein